MRTHRTVVLGASFLFAIAACATPPHPMPSLSAAAGAAATSAPPPESASAPPPPTDILAPPGWRSLGTPEVLEAGIVRAIASTLTGFVAVGCSGAARAVAECSAPAVWTSVDGVAWTPPIDLPLLPGELPRVATAALATDGGVIVAGEVGRGDRIHVAVWLASDGRTFERAPDGVSFVDASIGNLVDLNGSLVAVGSGAYTHYSGFKAWRSEDGITWTPTANGATDDYAPGGVVGIEGGVVAWGDTCSVCVPETAIWRSADGITWTGARRELEGEFAHATALSVTHAGLAAFGTTGVDPASPAAWSLPNGASAWQAGVPPPQPERTTIRTHLLVGHGDVLVGTSYSGDSPTALIWLRGPDDVAWPQPIAAPGVSVVTVLQHPDRPAELILVGEVDRNGRQVLALWSGSVDWAP